jgi:hypothetical protein
MMSLRIFSRNPIAISFHDWCGIITISDNYGIYPFLPGIRFDPLLVPGGNYSKVLDTCIQIWCIWHSNIGGRKGRRKSMTTTRTTNPWPELPLAKWKDTYDTLHRWTQIIGKMRLALTTPVNYADPWSNSIRTRYET